MPNRITGPVVNREVQRGDREWFSNLPVGQSPDIAVYFNDFIAAQDYAAADWVITTVEAGAGDASEALAADERNGALLITNDAADDDSDSLQLTEESWKLEAGERLWFETRLKVSDATQCDLFIGLCITDTTPLVTSDRVGFQKDDGDANIDCLTEKNTTETNTDSGQDLVSDTYVKLGFYWDGVSSVKFFVNRSLVATHTTNVPDDENLALTIHLVNGEAVAKTATIDYVYIAAERA